MGGAIKARSFGKLTRMMAKYSKFLTGFWLVLGLPFILNMSVCFYFCCEVVLGGWMVALRAGFGLWFG